MFVLKYAVVLLVVAAESVFAEKEYPCVWTDCEVECGGGKRTCNREPKGPYKIDCRMQSCTPADPCGQADVVFILDSSASLGAKNWWRVKQFAIDVTRGFTIAPDRTRVGLVSFSKEANAVFQLGEYNSADSVEEAIWASPWIAQNTNTKDALIRAQGIFNKTGRSSVKHIAVLLTDGISNVGKEFTIPQAEELHASGIEIFSLGIGDVDEEEVTGIASLKKDEHAFAIEDFTALIEITSKIVSSTCAAANKTVCDDFPEWGDECILDDPAKGCGEGNYVRSRECRFYLYEGAEPIVRTDTEEMPCTGKPCEPEPCQWTECDAECGGGLRECDNGEKVRRIRCNTQPCGLVLDCEPADVVFVLDSSGSIGPRNWARSKQFALDVTKGLNIGEDAFHVAALAYSRDVTVEWILNDDAAKDRDYMEALLWDMDWKKGRTHTYDGLRQAQDVLMTSSRPLAKKIVILVTDGLSNIKAHRTVPQAKKMHKAGITIFTIAVHETGSPEFEGIASTPKEDYLFNLQNYLELSAITREITKGTCDAAGQ